MKQNFSKLTRNLSMTLLMSCTLEIAHAQTSTNPLFYAEGFNVFTKSALTLTAGDTHGGVATGGDLNLNGQTVIGLNSAGTYPFGANNAMNYGMVIAGKINYTNGNVSYINNGYFRIGNTAGTNLYDKDNNNATINLRATHGTFDANPRVEMQRNQSVASATSAHGINFTNAFNQLDNNAQVIKGFGSNSNSCSTFNYIPVPATQNPHITLAANQINYLNLTTAQLSNLNNLGSIILDNHPDATHILIINVTGTGAYTWTPPNMGGINESDGAYVLNNFADLTSLTLSGGNSVYGTILAPKADVYKIGANNNNGQVAANSFTMAYGEVHYYPFAGSIPTCTTSTSNPINTYTPPTPLPLTAVSLKAAKAGSANKISWTAQADNLISSYTAERSNDGKSFIQLNNIAAQQSAGAREYAYEDNSAAAGTSYYRIRIASIDGMTGYSNTVKLTNALAATGISVYPAPFRNTLNVKINAAADQVNGTAELSDMTGKLLIRQSISGTPVTTISGVEMLVPGFYILRVTDNSGTVLSVQKLVKE